MSIFAPNQRTEEQQVYCDFVDQLLEQNKDHNISNGMPEHAVYLIAKLFGMASHHVRVYSDKLKHTIASSERDDNGSELDLYGHQEVIKRVARLLEIEGSRVSIVVENDIQDIEAHPLITTLLELENSGRIKGEFEIRKIDQKSLKWLNSENYTQHFIVSDSKAYRAENNDHEQNYAAIANFNNVDFSSRLIELFDTMHWKPSEKIIHIGAV